MSAKRRPVPRWAALTADKQILSDRTSPWLRDAMEARVAVIEQRGLLKLGVGVMAEFHGRPRPRGSRAVRLCDCCFVYVPKGQPLWVFARRPRPNVVLTGAVCTDCARREFGGHDE